MPTASGKFVLRLPQDLHARLRKLAAERETSLNQLCVELLEHRTAPAFGVAITDLDAPAIAKTWSAPLEGLVLFGSAARQERWDTSDIDLLVILPSGTAVTREHYDRWDRTVAPLFVNTRLSPSLVALPESAAEAGGIWCEAAIEGITLWDPALRISGFLIELRREIAAGKILRRYTHGQPYWLRPEAAA